MERLRRQLRFLLLLLGAVSLFISNAIAGEGLPPVTETVPIFATVEKYAKILVVVEPMDFGEFTGQLNEEIGPVDSAIFEVETNTALDLRFSAGDLKKDSSFLATKYQARRVLPTALLGWFNRDASYSPVLPIPDLVLTNAQAAGTIRQYAINGWAKTGPNVSSQEAGNYSATITLTVSAP